MAKEKIHDIGDEVEYKAKNGRMTKGKVYAVRKAEVDGEEKVISYLIDTGRENPDFKGREDRQPQQVEVFVDDKDAA